MKRYLQDALSRRNFFTRLTQAGLSVPALFSSLTESRAAAAPPPHDLWEQDVKRETLEKKTAFTKWAELEGIPIYTGYTVANLRETKLGQWNRLGVDGAIVYLDGDGGLVSGYLAEMAPGKKTARERHMYEEHMIVLSGSGETRVWVDGKPKVTAKWKAGTLFSVPMNTWHEHVNTGSEPARMFGATTAPLVLDLYRNPDFVFNNPYHFKDRFDSQPDFFDPEKAKTTPEAYPLSVNALRAGCNQKNNRFPLMEMELEDVEESLERLRAVGAVVEVQGGSRVSRFRHCGYEWLGVDKVELGVMAYVLQFAPQDFVNIPEHGTIQYHPSLLPRYRGPSSINWPISRGDTETGLRIIFLMAVPDKADYDDRILLRVYDEIIRVSQDAALVRKISRLTSHVQLFYLMEDYSQATDRGRK